MANQPTKYKKFVATAATATLVASAIVPVASAASFTDVPADSEYKPFIDKAVALGLFNDGETFNPTQSVKRSQVVLVMGRLLEATGVTADADYATNKAFSDVSSDELLKYGNIVKKAGVFTGLTDGTLNPNGNISRENMAIVFDRAAKAIAGVSLVELAAQIEDKTVADLATANSNYRDAIQALRDLEISTAENFGPKGDVQRRHFAKFAVTAIEVIQAAAKVDVAIATAKPVDAKTIEVTFNTAVEDTSKATIEVLRGTNKVVTTATWAEDKKSVKLASGANLAAGDYTVKISGLTETALTAAFKVEAQKLASIEIVGDTAVATNGEFKTATVGYVLKDQYGADVTKNYSVESGLTNATLSNGVVTITLAANAKAGDAVPVVLINRETGITVNKTLTLAAPAAVSALEVKGLINAKGEAVELNDLTDLSKGKVYVELEAKDQYGNVLTNPSQVANSLLLTNTNENIIKVADITALQKLTINKVDRLALEVTEVKAAGNVDLLFIQKSNGATVKHTVAVSETATTDGVNVLAPAEAYANEDVLVPLNVTDKAGNPITDVNVLSSATKGVKVGGTVVSKDALSVKDGQVYYKAKFTTAGYQSLVVQSSTYKTSTVTFEVKAAAVATKVAGVKSPLLLSIAKGPVTVTAADHLVIEDQYGRQITDATVLAATGVKVSVVGETDAFTQAAQQLTPVKKGTGIIKIELATPVDKVDSSFETQVRVTDGTEFTSYEVAAPGKVQAGVEKTLTVNGLLGDAKVALTPSEYTVSIYSSSKQVTVTDGKYTVTEALLDEKDGKKLDTEFTIRVTVNATGQVIEQKFVASNAAEQVQEFFLTSAAVGSAYANAKEVTDFILYSGATVGTALVTTDEAPKTITVATVDQYGNKKVVAFPTVNVTIVPEKVGEVTITGNGTATASATLAGDVKEAIVTIKFSIGTATKEIKAKVVAAPAGNL